MSQMRFRFRVVDVDQVENQFKQIQQKSNFQFSFSSRRWC